MDIRCYICKKLLAVGEVNWLKIKCNRCKTINAFSTSECLEHRTSTTDADDSNLHR